MSHIPTKLDVYLQIEVIMNATHYKSSKSVFYGMETSRSECNEYYRDHYKYGKSSGLKVVMSD